MTLDWISGEPPQPGSVVWCWFPYQQQIVSNLFAIQNSTNKRHPCLVLSVEKDIKNNHYLMVSGGTSLIGENGRQRKIETSDFVCRKNDQDFQVKTLEDTKFSLAYKDIFCLPYSRDYFYISNGNVWPKIGHIDLSSASNSYRIKFQKIADHIDLKNSICNRKKEMNI